MRLVGPSDQCRVIVDRGPYSIGDTVDVEVRFCPERNLHIREGRIYLMLAETYYAGPERGDNGKVREDHIILSESFLHDIDAIGGLEYRGEANFVIPQAAQPTAKTKIINLKWYCRAKIDVAGPDIFQDQEIGILPATLEKHAPSTASPVVTDAQFAECTLFLSFPSTHVRKGEMLSGILRGRAHRPLKIKQVRLELEYWETAGSKTRKRRMDRVIVHRGISLSADEQFEWQFQVRIPDGLSSINIGETLVVWYAKGILVRRGILYATTLLRSDYLQVPQAITVYAN